MIPFAFVFFFLISLWIFVPQFLGWDRFSFRSDEIKALLSTLRFQILLSGLFLGSLFVVMTIFSAKAIFKPAIFSILFLELIYYAPQIIWTTPRSFYEPQKVFGKKLTGFSAKILPPFRIAPIDLVFPGSIDEKKIKALAAARKWFFQGYNLNSGTVKGLAYAEKYGPLRLFQSYQLWTQSGLSLLEIYRLYGTRYFISSKKQDEGLFENPEISWVESFKGYHLYEDKGKKPMVWIAPHWREVDQFTPVKSLRDPVPIILSRGGSQPKRLRESGKILRTSEVKKVSVYSESYEIEAHIGSPSYLIISENSYPGWHAEIDGKEVKIDRAYHVFKAVFMVPGNHRVKFYFRPKAVHWGLWITGFSTIFLGIFTLVYYGLVKPNTLKI